MLDSVFVSKLKDDAVRLLDALTAMLEETMPEFTPLLKSVEDLKSFMESSKTNLHREQEKAAAESYKYEEKLKSLERQIAILEESQAEL